MEEREKPTEAATLALMQATIKWEHAAIRALFVLNGGALLAVLTFAGNAPELSAAMVLPVRIWVVGLASAAVTTIAAYFSQLAFHKRQGRLLDNKQQEAQTWGKRGIDIRKIAYLFGAVSLLCFISGAWTASSGLEGASGNPRLEIPKQ